MTVSALWDKARGNFNYTEWVLYPFLIFSLAVIYIAAHTLNVFMVLLAVPLIWHLRSIRVYGLVFGLIGALMLWAIMRSGVVELVSQGVPFAKAYAREGEYVHAPPLMILSCFTVILAGYSLTLPQATRVFRFYAWVLLALSVILLLNAVTQFQGLIWILENVVGGRTERAYIKVSNANCVLLMLFWPLVMYARQSGKSVLIVGPLIAIPMVSLFADTNMHLVALIASTIVFWVAAKWPQIWAQKGVLPQRVLAGLMAFGVVIFPVLVWWGHVSGASAKYKHVLPASWEARVEIWTFTLQRALEKPFLGWGYESARLFPDDIQVHPHNMSMQAFMELGIPGLFLLAAIWFAVSWRLDKGPAPADQDEARLRVVALPYALATISTIYVIYTSSYGLWRSWLYSSVALAVFAFILAYRASLTEMRRKSQELSEAGF